jgi:poly-beta-1,6-N-acetyl-D-glucosamine synthase
LVKKTEIFFKDSEMPIMDAPKYIVITPVRDEEKYLQKTIDSMVGQSVPPIQWIIVDDGSKDLTGRIIDSAARAIPWIKAIHREDRGIRDSAGGEIDAFYAGYAQIEVEDWQFIVKLDGDLSFEPDYFDKCLTNFHKNGQLGMGGGTILNVVNLELIHERHLPWHVRGAVKMYRRECWEAIGGLLNKPGWDTIDELKANYLGWETRTFPDLNVLHHRYTGAAVGNWKNAKKNGLCNYITGYHPFFMFVKCLRRIYYKPYFFHALGLWVGFMSGYINHLKQVDDKPFIRWVRQQQLLYLFGKVSLWGKRFNK